MKTYDLIHIKKAEILQIVSLGCLFNFPESEGLIFQGGTALRWMYNGTRFSEDLDFITTLSPEKINRIIPSFVQETENSMAMSGQNGRLTFSVKEKKSLTKVILTRQLERGNLQMKMEFYQVPSLTSIKSETSFLGGKPSVRACVVQNDLAQPHALVVCETPESILADKVIAVLKRSYIKGRDFWDMWFLQKILGVKLDADILRVHLALYPDPNVRSTECVPGHDGWPDRQKLLQEVEIDLQRFLPPKELDWWRTREFKEMISAVRSTLAESKNVLLAETRKNRDNGTPSIPSPSF